MFAALLGYKYVLVFFGLVLSGDIFLVGTIYSARFGFVELSTLFPVAIAASIVSDAVWYLLGRFLRRDRLEKLPMLRSKPALVAKLAALFERKGALLVFACKFLYGTRVITQVLCGVHKMKYKKYFFVNVAGSLIWISFLMALVTAVNASVGTLKSTVTKVEISLTIIIALFLAIRFITKRLFEKSLAGGENGEHGVAHPKNEDNNK